jgi:hypothetical protein
MIPTAPRQNHAPRNCRLISPWPRPRRWREGQRHGSRAPVHGGDRGSGSSPNPFSWHDRIFLTRSHAGRMLKPGRKVGRPGS